MKKRIFAGVLTFVMCLSLVQPAMGASHMPQICRRLDSGHGWELICPCRSSTERPSNGSCLYLK